jgi:NAD(P)-dependent dehydrogenase (short-subunit alcohol dehydrogenase family)
VNGSQKEGVREREVVVVTGASAGLGRAIAREFARHHARLGLVSRDPARLESVVGEVEHLGGEAIAIPADVSDPEAVHNAADEVERRFAPIDIWVNDAMTTVFAPFDQIRPDEYQRATEVTYLGMEHDGGAQENEGPRPRLHRPGGLGLGIPIDPFAGSLLRR